MAKFVPLHRQLHAGRSWNRPKNHGYAAAHALARIVAAEISHAATNMPLVFVKEGAGFELAALLSWKAGTNLFVGPDGRWLPDGYVPAVLRTYPFQLLRDAPEGRMALGFDEQSGLVVEGGGEAPLLQEDGGLSPSVTEILGILEAQEKSRRATATAIAALAAVDVIVPWELKIPIGATTKTIGGLFKIDEKRLQGLDDDGFLQLRRTGSLAVAYAQLISMVRVDLLARLAERQASAPSAPGRGSLADMLLQGADDTLRFD